MARRILGIFAAVAFVAVAFVWAASHRANVRALAEKESDEQAAQVLEKTVAALDAEAQKVATQAASGAELPGIVGLIQSPDSMSDPKGLENTILDLKHDEAWFMTYAESGAVALLYGEKVLYVSQPEYAAPMAAVARDAVRLERAGRVGHANGRAWLLGAARIPVNTTAERGVFVLGMPVDTARLESVAAQAGAAVGLKAKDGAWVYAGPAADVERLQRHPVSKVALHCCAVRETGGLEIAAGKDPSARLSAADSEASRAQLPIFAGAGVLAIVALVLGFRKPGEPQIEEQSKLLRETAAQLKQSQEELQRLSQRLSAPGVQLSSSPQPQPPDDGLGSTQASVAPSRYEVIAPLGEGGMARVSVAVVRGAEGFKRYFVLKRLRPELTGTTEIVNQFIDEARMGASLVHSNIVPVFDFGRDAEGYYLAQEYILGRDVDALVQASKEKRGRALELPIVLSIAQEVLKALSYAHTKTNDAGKPLGLVHRDVSPNNLMVSARGEVKLLDFGIVKSEDRVTKTQTGMVKGNLFFMSPEQARALPVDARADLFSFGLVLFYALTGDTLYSGNSSYELITRAGNGLTDADRARVNALGEPIASVLLKALRTDPAERFASADEFSRAIAAVGPQAPAVDVQALVEALFKSELAAERARFFGGGEAA